MKKSSATTASVTGDKAKELLRYVVRMFYEVKHAVLLDYVIHSQAIADDTLAERMHCQLKDIHRLMAVLRDDKLIKTEARIESRNPANNNASNTTSNNNSSDAVKTFTRTYLYMDYRLAVKVIRWRLEKIREASEQRLRADLEKKGYKCAVCGKKWSPLDVHSLNFNAEGFICDNCNLNLEFDEEEGKGEEEEGNDDGKDNKGHSPSSHSSLLIKKTRNPQELHVQLMECIAPLVQLLKQIKLDDLPAVKVIELIKKIHAPATLSASESTGGSSLPLPEKLDIGVVVELPEDAKEAQQGVDNSLPVWYTHSTVTGEKLHVAKTQDLGEALEEEPSIKKHKSTDIEIILDHDTADKNAIASNEDVHDPMVVVRGISKAFSQVTDDDKRMMTSDEYEVYFDHFLRIQGQ